MGRYQIHVKKTSDLQIDVYGLSADFRVIGGVNNNNTDKDPSPDPLVKLSSFSVHDPNVRYLKLEKRSLVQNFTSASPPPYNAKDDEVQDSENPEKMVEVLHKSKSRISEKTTPPQNASNTAPVKPKSQDANANEEPEYEMEVFGFYDFKDTKDPETYLVFQSFNTDSEETPNTKNADTNGNGSAEVPGNANEIPTISESSSEKPSGSGEVIIEDVNYGLNREQQQAEATSSGAIITEPEDENVGRNVPMAMCFSVGADLLITIILETELKSTEEIGPIKPKAMANSLLKSSSDQLENEKSLESVAVSELLFNVPYRELFEEELTHGEPESGTLLVRNERKQLIRTLILKRLIVLGLSELEAHDITDTWSTGYVQHRALSYRIPIVRTKRNPDPPIGPKALQKPIQVQLVHPVPAGTSYVDNFIWHAKNFKNIVNSSCCTLLESTFFLMIPHFKTKSDKNIPFFPGTAIDPKFIQNWIKLIKIAAFQLRPDDPSSIQPLVKKELKSLKTLLDSMVNMTNKIKEQIVYLNDKADKFSGKVYKKVRLNKISSEMLEEIKQSEEPINYAGLAYLQTVGFSAPDVFKNFIYMETSKHGLFLKRSPEDPWFPYSDLNFLERRIIFLAIMDHIYSTFDVILSTLRRLQELYTPGYPMSLFGKIRPLLDLLHGDHPYQLLAEDSKKQIYSATCGIKGSLTRFRSVFKELKKMIRETSTGIHDLNFTEESCETYNKSLGKGKHDKISLAVPFTTYPLDRLSTLKERGIQIQLSDVTKNEATGSAGK